jgi:phospholipase C
MQSLLGTSLVAVGCTVGCGPSAAVPPSRPGPSPNPALPDPQHSGIEHVIVVTMENRSFDHLLGWLPRAESMPSGLSFKDASGTTHPTYALSGDYQGCGHPVPDNSYGAPNLTAYNGGKMDGFLRVQGNDIYSIGYYKAGDIPFLAAFAQAFRTCDHWFASILAETFANRMFLWSAQTDRLSNTYSLSRLPTIFDRLQKAGVSHRYYFGDVPFLALWGLKYLFAAATLSEFFEDAASGKLPAVSFVDPKFTVLDDGLGNDDHPHSDIRNGDAFLSQVFHAVASGPHWASTVLIVTFDEWGGFFEHVPPPRVIAPNTIDTNLVNGEAPLGFRVPTVIASPFTRGANKVDSTIYDHTAILKLIEWRWGLTALSLRDASSQIGNPAVGFNFTSPDASVPQLPQPGTVPARPCFGQRTAARVQPSARERQPEQQLEEQPTTEFGAFGRTQLVQDWVNHPRFKQLPKP